MNDAAPESLRMKQILAFDELSCASFPRRKCMMLEPDRDAVWLALLAGALCTRAAAAPARPRLTVSVATHG